MFNSDRNLKLAQILLNHIWCVGICAAGHPLYTSDQPVVIYSHQLGQPTLGLAAVGVEITLPINNNLILILRERSFFEHEYGTDDFENHFVVVPPETVRHYNEMQVYMARLWVMCHENKFNHALEMLEHIDKTRLNGQLDEGFIRDKLRDTLETNQHN